MNNQCEAVDENECPLKRCTRCGEFVFDFEMKKCNDLYFHPRCFRCSNPLCQRFVTALTVYCTKKEIYCNYCGPKLCRLAGYGIGSQIGAFSTSAGYPTTWMPEHIIRYRNIESNKVWPPPPKIKDEEELCFPGECVLQEPDYSSPPGGNNMMGNNPAANGQFGNQQSFSPTPTLQKNQRLLDEPSGIVSRTAMPNPNAQRQNRSVMQNQMPQPSQNMNVARPFPQNQSMQMQPSRGFQNAQGAMPNNNHNIRSANMNGGSQQFGNETDICVRCNQPVPFQDRLFLCGNVMHKDCFRCEICQSPLEISISYDNCATIYCHNCFMQQNGPKKLPDVNYFNQCACPILSESFYKAFCSSNPNRCLCID